MGPWPSAGAGAKIRRPSSHPSTSLSDHPRDCAPSLTPDGNPCSNINRRNVVQLRTMFRSRRSLNRKYRIPSPSQTVLAVSRCMQKSAVAQSLSHPAIPLTPRVKTEGRARGPRQGEAHYDSPRGEGGGAWRPSWDPSLAPGLAIDLRHNPRHIPSPSIDIISLFTSTKCPARAFDVRTV
jgi:hypothetical protein